MNPSPPARFQEELQRKIRGDVLLDEMSRLLYSTDASLYQVKPLGVVLPCGREDVLQAIRTAVKYGVPVLPRGAGTSLAGQTVTPGLVIDCSKYMNRILEVDSAQRWARVEPGIVLDNLNDFLTFHGLFFAPDVATSSRATIGGMIGNNSAGVHSIRYGKTVDHLLGLSVILSTGEELEFHSLERGGLEEKCCRAGREGNLYRSIRGIVRENRSEILLRYPKVMRRVGGYNLDALVDEDHFNLAKLLVGSEGTLAFVTEAKLNLEPLPRSKVTCVIHFASLVKATDAVAVILRHGPSAVEILDHWGLKLASKNPAVADLYETFIEGTPEAVLLVEFSGPSKEGVASSAAGLRDDAALRRLSYHLSPAYEGRRQQNVWQVRKNALGVLLAMKGDAKPLPFIEDACVPVSHLSAYVSQIVKLCRSLDRPVALYAHASAGVIHVRPILNLKEREDVQIMRRISEEAFRLVVGYGGAWSGEHGDGLVRSYKNPEFFGPKLFRAFGSVKAAFDPPGLMNPGKIVQTPDMTENLRIHPGYRTVVPPTYFRFGPERGFDRAIEMCTGVGHCRKTLGGTMCPSYMATREEEHSTRGRANALRSAIAGEMGPDGLTSHSLYQTLDLCLECKACKSECPSNVDMARLKAEFLAHYYQRHGLPLGKRLVARTHETARLASRAPWLFNLAVQNPLARWLLEKSAGIDRRRSLLRYASRTLEQWYEAHRRQSQASASGAQVALFVDTFTNFFQPRIGVSAVRLVEALGYSVTLADAGCCGRPLISSGLLAEAKERGGELIRRLRPVAENGVPIVVLEPSCFSTLRDDYSDLIEDAATCRLVSDHIFSLEEFLNQEEVYIRLLEKMDKGPSRILFHGHCQQKALIGTKESMRALGSLRESGIDEVDAGCCGMAGSFGYERHHYALSEKIGARRLFPAVEKTGPETTIVASGFSCRSQIQHFTGRRASHLAEVLAESLKPGC
ncbi:MAG: FAD-binding and (Fe-S)-binding domain-containing protein [Acidobacteriota bacterium]